MKYKRIISSVIAVFILAMNVLPFFAVSDADADAQKYCICGRPYYTQTTDEHNIYECVNCGNARSNCTCKCWCGAETTASDEVAINGVPAHICSGCGQLCAHCTCGDREAVLKLEEQIRLGNVFAGKVEKPENLLPTLLAVIFAAAVALMYAMYSAVKKNEQTKEKQHERTLMMRKHRKILEKIDEQANYTASAPSAARLAAEKAINWDSDLINPATIAFELSNAVHSGVSANKEMLPFMRFIADSALDEDTAEAAAYNGSYGSVIQLSATVQKEIEAGKVYQEVSDYFDHDYFYNNEQAIHKILGDYGIGSAEADTLAYLPCSCEVRFGSTLATAARWAEETSCNESDDSLTSGKRFAERYLTGGGRK